MKVQKRFYDETTGVAVYRLYDRKTKKTYVGTAQAHPEDAEIANEVKGLRIAKIRARLAKQDDKLKQKKALAANLARLLDFTNKQIAEHQRTKQKLENELDDVLYEDLIKNLEVVYGFIYLDFKL